MNKKIITKDIKNELENIILENLKKHKCTLNKIYIEEQNKVTLEFSASPYIQLSKLVNNLKTVSSRLIRKDFKEYLKSHDMNDNFWDYKYYIHTVTV